MCEEAQFTPPWWDEVASRKHRRTGTRGEKMWDSSILTSQTKDGCAPAVYDPRIQRDEIGRMEMECVAQGIEGVPGITELPQKLPHVRKFYRVLDRIIGASKGEKTNCILVLYQKTGSVHGYPVTPEYLKSKGAKVQ